MSFPKSSVLERELADQLRGNAGGEVRAMSATIVIIADAGQAAVADAVVEKLMGRRPARVIRIRIGVGQTGTAFRASASARCALDRGNRGVCFEDIYLESSDAAAADPRLWGPFALRELPSLLYWTYPEATADWPCAGAADRFRACARAVDLVVIDGCVLPDIDARSLLSSGIGPLADLAWLRSERFRLAAAGLFDDAAVALIDGIVGIDLRGAQLWPLALTAGWLRSRLTKPDIRFRLKVDAETFCALRFRLADGREAAVDFPSPRLARLILPDGRRRELGFPLPDDGAIWADLVDAPTVDPLYFSALEAISGENAFLYALE